MDKEIQETGFLRGGIEIRVQELVRQISCEAYDVELIKGHVSKDHVHLSYLYHSI